MNILRNVFPRMVIPLALALCLSATAADLEESFRNPPNSAKPHTWWHWMNGNVSMEGITADLEAMARVGVGGCQAFHVSDNIPAGPVGYMSDEWRGMMKHAIEEADRLGLEICLHNCAGWSSSGGPWVTPEYAMFEVVSSETKAQGEGVFSDQLAQPPMKHNYYRDIAVLAFPTPRNDDKPAQRLKDWKLKSGYGRSNDLPPDERSMAGEGIIARNRIINLTGRMDKTGQLVWRAPAGDWTVVRFGYTPTGATNRPAPTEGVGLECDKMSTDAAELHWQHSMQKVIEDVGPLAGRVFSSVLIDSYEVKHQNWTHRFAEEFQRRRGYDLTPYLPCLTGRIVQSVDVSERFLWDFRRTIADLFGEYYFGHFAEMCRRNGMRLAIEPYGRSGNFDDFTVAEYADIPMGEWWARREARWHHWSGKLASSAAHAYGRRIVGAEAFTAGGKDAAWVNHPYLLKSQGDYFHCQGVNRFIFHDFAHHPRVDLKPGMTMGPHGFQFNRGNTWWEQGSAWLTYLARCQYMIQEGRQVADIFYFPGEQSPNTLKPREELRPAIPYGYDYDACGADVVMRMTVDNGRLVLPSGMSYGVLLLSDGASMRPELLAKISELAKGGATVVGTRPTRSPSLQNYPECDAAIGDLAKSIDWDRPLEKVLSDRGLKPDFEFVGATPVNDTEYAGNGVEYIHRTVADNDVYFVSNQHPRAKVIDCLFRIRDRMPELWHPDTGETEPAPIHAPTGDGRTMVRLGMDPAGSVFVVFRKPASADSVVRIVCNGEDLYEKVASSGLLEIKSAIYGVVSPTVRPDQSVDVTAKLRSMVRGNRLQVVIDNNLAGDPAKLVRKELLIEYVLAGITTTRKVSEKGTLEVGVQHDVEVKPAPADLRITDRGTVLRAWQPGRYDVTTKAGKTVRVDVDEVPEPMAITGPWELTFPEGWGAPPQATFAALLSWPQHEDEGIRHFSGTATYVTSFRWERPPLGRPATSTVLDLGDVQVIAEVTLNGKPLDILWKPPFTTEISDILKPGENQLEIKVTNLWPNRLIGDEKYEDDAKWKPQGRARARAGGLAAFPEWYVQGKPRPPSERHTWTTWKHYSKNSPLLPSGLLGPVRIRAAVLMDVPLGR